MNPPTPSLQEIASCVNGYDPNALPVASAQAFIAQLVPRVQAVEMLALRSSLGRVLARDIVSAINVPAHDNSGWTATPCAGPTWPRKETASCK